MYEGFFGLRERPFDLAPDPRFLFLSARHREALAHLRYGLGGRPGITVLVGEAGTGKTTLVKAALQSVNGGASAPAILHLSNPTLTMREFYEYLTAGFGFPADVSHSKTRFLKELELAMQTREETGSTLALVVDEAQSLPYELLEEIRLLTNVQTQSGKAPTVALVGQPELATRLEEQRLRQLKQRVALRCELAPLDLLETAAYIATRIRVAGGKPEFLFTRDAVTAIYEHARGIPRTIGVICDNALVNGYASETKPIGREIVLEVCRDFRLGAFAKVSPMPKPNRSAVRPVESRGEADSVEDVENGSESTKPMFSTFGRARRFFIF